MLFTHATASRIKTYKQCEFKYFLEYMVQYPPMRGDSIYTGKGSAVHEALEGWANFKLGKKAEDGFLVEENWEETLRKYYEKSKLWTLDERTPDKNGSPRGFPHPVEKTCETCPWATKDNRCEISNMAIGATDGCPRPNFEDDVALTQKTLDRTDYPILALDGDGNFVKKIIGAEVPFDMDIEGIRVRGVMDLVFEEDKNTLEVCDYKTGKSMSYTAAEKDAQVRIYGKVARILWPQYKYIVVTLHYLRKTEVSVPLSERDDVDTMRSLKLRAKQITENEDPSQVKPSKWGFPCDWCIGYDTCVKVRDKFKVDGKFKLPTISCMFANQVGPCWGNIYPLEGQDVNPDNVNEMLYICKGHGKINDGEEYIPDPANINTTAGRNGDNSEEI